MEPAPARIRRIGSTTTWLRVGLAVLAVVVLWSAAWFYVPPIVAAQAEKAALRELGRRLSVGRVTFNPWTLELTHRRRSRSPAPPTARRRCSRPGASMPTSPSSRCSGSRR